jgi:GT2 family glycosyltransferase
MKENGYDAIAFLANDIEEPDNWLAKKVEALISYPDAGVVASSLDCARTTLINELIISNWLISKETIEKIGYFNESMFPYGPIDLDYCERCYAAGLKTYYTMDCLAVHSGSHATGNEYGWSKDKAVAEGWGKMFKKGDEYYKSRNDGKE